MEIKNPCKKCLVTSMCKQACDPFILYIEQIISKQQSGAAAFVAKEIRRGNATFIKCCIWRKGTITI